MAVFDYRCEDCNNIDERIRKPDVLKEVCSKCGGVAHKMVCAPAYINGGFYDAKNKHINENIEKLERKTGISQGGH